MSEILLKILWFIEFKTMKGFPKLGIVTEADLIWAKNQVSKISLT